MASIRQLKMALAVAEAKHYAKAGDLCHLAQTTVSIGVAKLEDEIGYKLFKKAGSGSIKRFDGVTERGAVFLSKAAKIVADYDEMMKG